MEYSRENALPFAVVCFLSVFGPLGVTCIAIVSCAMHIDSLDKLLNGFTLHRIYSGHTAIRAPDGTLPIAPHVEFHEVVESNGRDYVIGRRDSGSWFILDTRSWKLGEGTEEQVYQLLNNPGELSIGKGANR